MSTISMQMLAVIGLSSIAATYYIVTVVVPYCSRLSGVLKG